MINLRLIIQLLLFVNIIQSSCLKYNCLNLTNDNLLHNGLYNCTSRHKNLTSYNILVENTKFISGNNGCLNFFSSSFCINEKHLILNCISSENSNISIWEIGSYMQNMSNIQGKKLAVDLSRNKIKQLIDPERNFESIIALNLSHNLIDIVLSHAFDNFSNLSMLDLSNNLIKALKSDTFRITFAIESINLRNNQISEIPQGLFHSNLKNLVNIYLQNNSITEVELWPIFLPKIILVDFSNNPIRELTNKFQLDLTKLYSNDSNMPGLEIAAEVRLKYIDNTFMDLNDQHFKQYGVSDTDFVFYFGKCFRIFNFPTSNCNCTTQKLFISTYQQYSAVPNNTRRVLQCIYNKKSVNLSDTYICNENELETTIIPTEESNSDISTGKNNYSY
jgi:hypothetical protein